MCTLGPSLLVRATAKSRVPVRAALADRDFEDWLYASAETLGWDRGMPIPNKEDRLRSKSALETAGLREAGVATKAGGQNGPRSRNCEEPEFRAHAATVRRAA